MKKKTSTASKAPKSKKKASGASQNWQGQLKEFLARFLKTAEQRTHIFARFSAILKELPETEVGKLIKILDKTFNRGFKKFQATKTQDVKTRLAAAYREFIKNCKNLKPEERKVIVSLCVTLLFTVFLRRLPLISRFRKIA